MEPESLADGVLNVSVPTRFLRSWIKSHYVDQLTACCAAEYKDITLVEIQVRTRGLPTVAQAVTPVAGLKTVSSSLSSLSQRLSGPACRNVIAARSLITT
jgi:chromosomal replication initiation ATPase DnaA